MCEFLCRAEPKPENVCLEISAAGGRLSAAIRPPACEPDMIAFDYVPLLRAVKMAKLMGDMLSTDIIVVDRVGLWDEWLLARAFEPEERPAILREDPDLAAGGLGGEPRSALPGPLHAPAR